ncbi:MAG: RNA 2',3'-cyclic phosphodiesterase [Chromatiales bacterium]|nr:MAG: RNA 2',3'-cyclic phosphodiesterase [Chromatiales bacterium]
MSAVRLFFALWPDAPTRRKLRKVCRDAVAFSGGRPVPPQHYHLTLAFLGNVPVAQVPAIRAAATGVAAPTLTLQLDRFGYFSRARVLWIGPTEAPAELAQLAASLWAALEPVGLQPELRPFHPHLTIARKVHRAPRDPQARPVAWPVRGFVLVRSVTEPTGARYTVDQCFPEGSSNEP